MTDTIALILSVVGSAVTVTWVLRSKLSDVERAMATHVAHDEMTHAAQDARIIKIEKARRR